MKKRNFLLLIVKRVVKIRKYVNAKRDIYTIYIVYFKNALFIILESGDKISNFEESCIM